jgi:hypothetical protein
MILQIPKQKTVGLNDKKNLLFFLLLKVTVKLNEWTQRIVFVVSTLGLITKYIIHVQSFTCLKQNENKYFNILVCFSNWKKRLVNTWFSFLSYKVNFHFFLSTLKMKRPIRPNLSLVSGIISARHWRLCHALWNNIVYRC